MTTYANVGHILLKRGNTIQSAAYTGPVGEVTYDTDLKTIRVHDGNTAGGSAILINQPELIAYQTYANATAMVQYDAITTLQGQVYTDSNVASYLLTYQGNIGVSSTGNINTGNFYATNGFFSGNLSITGNTYYNNVGTIVTTAILANATTPSTSTGTGAILTYGGVGVAGNIFANVAYTNRGYFYANGQAYLSNTDPVISSLIANAASQQTTLGNIAANIAAFQTYANVHFTDSSYSNANVASYLPTSSIITGINTKVIAANLQITNLWSNAGVQSANIATLTANAGTQADAIASLTANAGIQSANIATLQTQVYANANVAAYLPTYSGNIAANIVKNGYTWTFGTDGTTTLPAGGVIAEGGGLTGAIRLTPAGGSNANQALLIYPTAAGNEDHVHLTAGGGATELYLGDDYHYVKLVDGGNVEIRATTANASSTAAWNFSTDGNLSLPTDGYLRVGTGIVPVSLTSSPAPIISGFSTISAQNFTFLANGVNILSTVAGTYSNTNAAAYLTTQTFYSNTNVAAYLVANPQGSTYSNTNVAAYLTTQTFYSNANVVANLQNLVTNVVTTANVQANYFVGNGAALTGITANGYSNIYGTTSNVTLVAGSYSYVFDNTGNLTLPTNGDIIMPGTNSILSASGTTLLGGATQAVGSYSTLGVSYPGAGTQFGMTLRPAADNTTAINFLNASGNSVGNITQTASTVKFTGDGSGLSNVAIKTTGSWTVATGTNTYSFTVPVNGVYQLWVECNIPNGILAYNATATVTNSNVPVVGAQYAWVYTGGGTPIDFTSIPNQFTGTANTIVRSSVAPSATTNRFDFGINNTSGSSQTAYWGYVRID